MQITALAGETVDDEILVRAGADRALDDRRGEAGVRRRAERRLDEAGETNESANASGNESANASALVSTNTVSANVGRPQYLPHGAVAPPPRRGGGAGVAAWSIVEGGEDVDFSDGSAQLTGVGGPFKFAPNVLTVGARYMAARGVDGRSPGRWRRDGRCA